MRLDQILDGIHVADMAGSAVADVTGVVCDSRQVRPGALFVAIRGSKEDGTAYIEDAMARGAAAILSESHVSGPRTVCRIRVANARHALAQAAATFYGHPSRKLDVVGVTGTNGKTTTAYLVRDMLRLAGRAPGLISTVEYVIGSRSIPARRTTPESPALQDLLAQMVHAGCGSAVMEVSSHALDQDRAVGIDFNVAVFTNLTRDHLDYHVTMEHYFAAKTRLFTSLDRSDRPGTGVINQDDPWGRRLLEGEARPTRVLTYGVAGRTPSAADVSAVDVILEESGTRFRAVTPWGETEVRLGLLGRFNVSNALAAMAAAGQLGVKLDDIRTVLAGNTVVPGRLEKIDAGRKIKVFVDYAHTDDALENVLSTLREITPGRLLVVFGCGGDRDRTKRPAMGAVASRLADVSILTSDNPRSESPRAIIAEIEAGFAPGSTYEVVEDRRQAIAAALAMASRGDTVLIAGKGHETFQEFANKTIPFDDRQVVKECL